MSVPIGFASLGARLRLRVIRSRRLSLLSIGCARPSLALQVAPFRRYYTTPVLARSRTTTTEEVLR